jgi:cobyrinic acid a,c-diamide synthase
MQITRQQVADQIGAYLRHQLTLENMVDWAEQQVLEGEFESTTVRDAVARLGIADVRAFGLTWDDCEQLLRELGFAARVEIAIAK